MSISDEQNRVAKNHRQDREGKKLVAGHFDEAVSKTLRGIALKQDRTMQDLLEEAVGDFLIKHGEDSASVQQFFKTRTPR